MKALHTIAFLLLVVGGLNWLLQGALGWDVSKFLGGPEALIPRVIYVLVGVAAVVEIATHKGACKTCDKGGTKPMNMG